MAAHGPRPPEPPIFRGTVRRSRGTVRLTRVMRARGRGVSGQRGRSPPPSARTSTVSPNGYPSLRPALRPSQHPRFPFRQTAQSSSELLTPELPQHDVNTTAVTGSFATGTSRDEDRAQSGSLGSSERSPDATMTHDPMRARLEALIRQRWSPPARQSAPADSSLSPATTTAGHGTWAGATAIDRPESRSPC